MIMERSMPSDYVRSEDTSLDSSSEPDSSVLSRHSSSSLNFLPAMNEHGSTPDPSSDHPEMAAQNSYFTVLDDDQYNPNQPRNSLDASQLSTLRRGAASVPYSPAQSRRELLIPSSSLHRESSIDSRPRPRSSAVPTAPSHRNVTVATRHTFNPNVRDGHSSSTFSFLPTVNSGGEASKILKIELSQPETILKNGEVSVMEGTVYVNLHKNIKVKTLQLEFIGRTTINWIDDNTYASSTKHTSAPHIDHSWSLIAHEHKQPPTPLQAGQHAYSFSLELPDTLPETLSTAHGKVSYKLSASLIKSGLSFHTHTTSAPVLIRRQHPIFASRSYQQGGRCSNDHGDEIRYKITMPQIRVPHATKVPLQVSITSPSSIIQVHVLQVGLWERVIYKVDGRRKVDMRLVKIQKSEGWGRPPHHETEAWNWNKVLLFDMPRMGSDLNQCNPTAENGLMKVEHNLRFSILGSNGSNRFRVENEIEVNVLAYEDEIIIDPSEEEFTIDSELPSYLTSFTTPRVSIDESDRSLDPADDDMLRNMLHRIHLPTYTESESVVNSENNSRNESRDQSRSTSPDRPASGNRMPDSPSSNNPYNCYLNCHQTNTQSPLSENAFFPSTPTAEYPYPMNIPNIVSRHSINTSTQ